MGVSGRLTCGLAFRACNTVALGNSLDHPLNSCILSRLQCGGFLADKWLGEPQPDPYRDSITPSQRKVCHSMFIVSLIQTGRATRIRSLNPSCLIPLTSVMLISYPCLSPPAALRHRPNYTLVGPLPRNLSTGLPPPIRVRLLCLVVHLPNASGESLRMNLRLFPSPNQPVLSHCLTFPNMENRPWVVNVNPCDDYGSRFALCDV